MFPPWAARITGYALILAGAGVVYAVWAYPAAWVGVALIGLGVGAVWRASAGE